MNKILVLGAGKSSKYLIDYLLNQAEKFDWEVVVGDLDQNTAAAKVQNHKNGRPIAFNINNESDCSKYIGWADIAVSLLPMQFHIRVAEFCLTSKTHLITASYIKEDALELHDRFVDEGLLYMGEMGLDPGIDHLAIMSMINEVRDAGGDINTVNSYTGALIAPESDTNPWHYKFSWAPMNVVKAGQGIAKYLYHHSPKYIPYQRVFGSYLTREVDGIGTIEVYPNRNSLEYKRKYDLEEVGTLLRGTIRYKGFCDAWNMLVKLGLTDDTYTINSNDFTYRSLLKAFIPRKLDTGEVESDLCRFLEIDENSEQMHQLTWLGLLKDEKIGMGELTPAEFLCCVLQKKWKLQPEDKDLVLMLHEVDYFLEGKEYRKTATLQVKGQDSEDTAIAKTVGLPAGMMTKLLATGAVILRGVHRPLYKEIYQPVLEELKDYGICFEERTEVVRMNK